MKLVVVVVGVCFCYGLNGSKVQKPKDLNLDFCSFFLIGNWLPVNTVFISITDLNKVYSRPRSEKISATTSNVCTFSVEALVIYKCMF